MKKDDLTKSVYNSALMNLNQTNKSIELPRLESKFSNVFEKSMQIRSSMDKHSIESPRLNRDQQFRLMSPFALRETFCTTPITRKLRQAVISAEKSSKLLKFTSVSRKPSIKDESE